MSEQLVEAVARQLCKAHLYGTDWRNWADEARAAIAVVLEEAAKVAEGKRPAPDFQEPMLRVGYFCAGHEIATDIRALIKEPT